MSEISRYLTEPNHDLARMRHDTIPGMAHWAGSGPKGQICGNCIHLTLLGGRKILHRCSKYTQLMGRQGPKDIPDDTPACRHFEKPKREKKRA